MTIGVQLDLFARRRRPFDEAALLARLREVEFLDRTQIGARTFTRAEVRRLMRPLPPITVPR